MIIEAPGETRPEPQTNVLPLILIVDDIAENIRILGNMLAENKFRIAVATNGLQALRIVSVSKPALILLDIQMPGMDGYEVCRRLKADDSTRDIPIIFLTARVEPEDVLRGFTMGAVDYVTKPFRSAELVARVTTQIQLSQTKLELVATNELLDQKNSELKELNATKDKFFSILAHDLRNPFQGLLGYSALLLQEFDSLTHEEVITYITQIHQICDNTFVLLENMLEWSRVQMNRIEIFLQSLELASFVDQLLEFVHLNAMAKNIQVVNDIPIGLMVVADRKILHSIFLNLVTNAVKFTNGGGQVRIAASGSNDEVVVSVEDNGVGISAENQQKLFHLDKQHSTKGTANERGTGLGLLLCKEMISKLGGAIWCSSTVGRGSVFSFTLKTQMENAVTAETHSQDTSSSKVLQ